MGRMRDRMLSGELGDDAVVGAGAVFTRDLPAGVVALGVPTRVVREIAERDRIDVPRR